MIEIIISTIHKTEYKTGVATFSALGGWQLANNAMFVLKHVEFDSTTFSSKTSKELSVFIKHYYSSRKAMDTLNTYEDTDINAQFIWNRVSPLRLYEKYYFLRLYSLKSYDIHLSDETSKRYIFFDAHTISWGANGPEYVLIKRQPEYYLESFTTMGPVFNEFGTEVIKKYPLEYLRYFIWPNIISYIHPPMEAYVNYNHYLPYRPLLISFYDFTSNDFSRTHEKWITEFMYPWSWIFTIINVLFLLLVVAYYFKHGYKSDLWFNQCLAFYTFFYISNFLFSILVAPNYFRYHVAIVTLCMAFIIYLWERVFGTEKKIIKDN